ncbi:hypothetical protein niasHT_024175 [Heterodera trifolii]|uniref:26S proteasome non-ATPase regulatory subunit 14 n=1 Tax=Heterodera trifolii TaxID=157864 RepID=A0ABD2JLV2_9BILA
MERLLRLGGLSGLGSGSLNATPHDSNQVDTSETVYISSLALLKMLKHGRAGVPMEVMGLMLGEFVDDYTVNVIDVFAMPQSGTGVSVEAVDPVFQAKMLDMLKQTGRPEMVVGWYHSHPGFGCWLSGVDINTQQSFEALSDRAVAVVVDPIQSVKGKVVIDAFRTINPQAIALNQEPRQTTSNIGHLQKPSIQALIHGLNRHYYSIPIAYRTNENEQQMLLNLNKQSWMDSMNLVNYNDHCARTEKAVEHMLKLAKLYKKSLEEEEKMTEEQLAIKNVGKQDPKRHLGETVSQLLADNLVQGLAAMLDVSAFHLVKKEDSSVHDQSNSFSAPKNAEQLSKCLLDVGTAKRLLASKLPLTELRPLMIGCYMRYHAIREILKDSECNFFIDKIIHVNRDGIRFKHCRDNSYRSIHKIKEPENAIDQRGFNLWINDMKKWNESLPCMDLQLLMLNSIRNAVSSLEEGESQSFVDSTDKTIVPEMPCNISRASLTKLVITIEEMVKLIDYGRELFDRTVTGFYTQIRAPPNPNVPKDKKGGESFIFMDQIIGVSWATKPYMLLQRPLTIVLKFRHFRDERICQLPYWNKSDGISQEIYNHWLNDMRQWDEEYPSLEFIEKKSKELVTVLSEPPRGPPVDVIRLATIEAERENSTKLLKKLKEWQEEQKVGNAMHQPFPPLRQPFYPPSRPIRFPHWPFHHGPSQPRPHLMYGRSVGYHPYANQFHRPMTQARMRPPFCYGASQSFGLHRYPRNIPANSASNFQPEALKNSALKKSQSAMEWTTNRPASYFPRNDYAAFSISQVGYTGDIWF